MDSAMGLNDTKTAVIYELLYQMGLGPHRVIFFYTACAARHVLEAPSDVLRITKNVYPEVARRCETNPSAVEHGIRRAINRIWKTNPQLFAIHLGVEVTKRPTPTWFLVLIARKVELILSSRP